MKNVKVILISVVLCAAVFANSRIAALGGDAGFWSGDRANIAIFPATINDHDFVEMDGIGDDGGDGVNATILWGDATTWGFGFDGDDDATWMNIYWGNGDVGLNVQYKSADDGAGLATSETDGFAVSYGQNFDWGELGCGFKTGDENNDDSEYWAHWRDDMSAWIFDSAKASLTSTDNGQDGAANQTTMDLSFDMFTHLDAGGADVLFGLGVDYKSQDSDGTGATSMTLPSATLAIEADLTDWATLRAWATHEYNFSCTNDATGSTDPCTDDATGPGSTGYGFGLGFNWGAATLDMQIGEDLFLDPVTTMAGWDDADLASEASVTLSYGF